MDSDTNSIALTRKEGESVVLRDECGNYLGTVTLSECIGTKRAKLRFTGRIVVRRSEIDVEE